MNWGMNGLGILMVLTLISAARAEPSGLLNDTGQTQCRNIGSSRLEQCAPSNSSDVSLGPVQDGRYGRDAAAKYPAQSGFTKPEGSGGHGGFAFTPLDVNGNPIPLVGDPPVPAETPRCVWDRVTNLIWEIKTDDGGLQDKDWTYGWGSNNTGLCYENQSPVGCGNINYIAALNSAMVCPTSGAGNWRLPTRRELLSIVNHNHYFHRPTIDTDYFPNTIGYRYWSADLVASNPRFAWSVEFFSGLTDPEYPEKDNVHLRLVRSGPGDNLIQQPFVDNGNGTVTDIINGLMWDKCPWGMSGANCETGLAGAYNWAHALSVAVKANQEHWLGYNDWRLPNLAEIESLVDIKKTSGTAINTTAFPRTPASFFWSSTTFPEVPGGYPWAREWVVNFEYGRVGGSNPYNDESVFRYHVRLVRGGLSHNSFDSQQYLVTALFSAADKIYDGTTLATTSCTLIRVTADDDVTCSATSVRFSDPNAGTNKWVTATGITLSGSDAGKYTLMNTTATTTADILKAPATVTLANLSQTYTGSPLTPSATTNPASLAFTWTGAPQTNAGNYPVTATVNEQNYEGSASGTFVIQRAPATVTLADLSQTYTGLPLSPTVTTVPAGLTYSLSGAPQTNAGSYPVTATMTNPNYSGTASGSFVIAQVAQAPVFISAPASAMYQQADLSVFGYGGTGTGSFSYSSAGSTACSVDALTGALSITSGSGLCQVTATRAGDQNHLPASSIAANILVVKAPQAALTISATPASLVSGGAGSTLSSVGGSTGGAVTYAATASPGLTCTISGNLLSAGGAGTCSVTGTLAGNANYEPVTSPALAVPVLLETGPSGLFSAVLPYARSVPIGQPATAFGTLINATGVDAIGCALALPVSPAIPATFNYQTTNASNQLVGTPNTPVNIPAWGSQSFIFGITPGAAFAATDIPIVFDCANTLRAPSQVGLNTFLLSASSTPVPDMVAIGATPSGDGVLRLPGSNGVHAFATAAVNIGGAGEVTATVDTGGVPLPLALTVCQTHPVTGACVFPPAASTTRTLATNASATYAVFAQASGAIPLDPAGKRIFLRLSSGGVVRGATSVAVTTQ